MLDMLSGALASAKTASEMGKTILELRDGEKIRAAVFELRSQLMELQQHVLDAKEEQLRLLERNAELETRLADKAAEDQLRARYRLLQLDGGSFAYVLRHESHGDEPLHYLCATCYVDHRHVILQPAGSNFWTGYKCPACETVITVTSRPTAGPSIDIC
jgi:hypothetical protein